MIYRLGDYRYKDGKIQKKMFRIIFRCIDKGPYTYREGVGYINRLCEVDVWALKG